MDFLLIFKISEHINFKVQYTEQLSLSGDLNNVLQICQLKHLMYLHIRDDEYESYYAGDVIKINSKSENKFKGIYYKFCLTANLTILEISPDRHNLLPVYFVNNIDSVIVSSSYELLACHLSKKKKNCLFYLELALFHTPLEGNTYIEGIKRLEYGCRIILSVKGFEIKRKYRFFDNFVMQPLRYKDAVNEITDLYIENSKYYFGEKNVISFTGGFDGRTNVACAHHNKVEFTTFSYGKPGSMDIDIPCSIAGKLGFEYQLLLLDEEYLTNCYVSLVREYLNLSGGQNGFRSPQSLYFARVFGNETNTIVTGYLGSELHRSIREPDDEIAAKCVLDFIDKNELNKNYIDSLIVLLRNIGILQDKQDVSSIMLDLHSYFSQLPEYLTKNQMLSTFIFENVIQHTFGTWIYNGLHYAPLRVPFIDDDYFDALIKTEVSQFYRNFLEPNMRKRKVGPQIYSYIMKKTYKPLAKLPISKGYSPNDLTTLWGNINIAYNKLKLRKIKDPNGIDKLSTVSGARDYINDNYDLIKKKDTLFKYLNQSTSTRDLVFLYLSGYEYNKLMQISTL